MAIHALVIGNNYKGTQNALPDCELDAHNVAHWLRPYSKSLELVTGTKATREGILHSGKKSKARLADGDLWVVYNSGHGTWEMKGGRRIEAVVCHGFGLIYDFEMDELLDEGRPAESRVLAISDSCFSDGMSRELHKHLVRTIPLGRCRSHRAKPPTKDRFLPGVVFLSGCATKEESISTGQGGAMTNALGQALAELGPSAPLERIFERVGGQGGLLPSDDYPQHPQWHGAAADLRRSLNSFVAATAQK